MKKFFNCILLCLLLMAITPGRSLSQSLNCCVKSATAEFALLGADEKFQSEHLAPLPFNFVPAKGKMITVKTGDGRDASGFEIRPSTPSKKYLFVFQEWWGLNDYIKQEAENLSEELQDVNIIAPDLYDGRLATTAEEAGKMMKETKDARIRAIITAFLKHAGPEATIQTIGWCFGGGWSLQASMMAGKQTAGCVMYYGMPETDPVKIKAIEFPVLAIFASQDGHITPEIARKFEKDMIEAGKNINVKFYEAEHAFANPSNPQFNREATEEAHTHAISFLRENFK